MHVDCAPISTLTIFKHPNAVRFECGFQPAEHKSPFKLKHNPMNVKEIYSVQTVGHVWAHKLLTAMSLVKSQPLCKNLSRWVLGLK